MPRNTRNIQWSTLLNKKNIELFQKLNTPEHIQDFLNAIPFNFSDSLSSPGETIRRKSAHCLEGALLAAAVLWYWGYQPRLLDLRSKKGDDDHVVALFKKGAYWGAISKTNHAVLRYRDPIYRSIRELAMSYFHEYFLNASGEKTLIDYSVPFSLKRFGVSWLNDEEDLWYIGEALDNAAHVRFVPRGTRLRKADQVERKAGRIVEWERDKK